MTDNEIIKALEYCEDSADTDKHCLKCPYCNESYCLDKMMAAALSLINRQKAEIGRLQNKVEELSEVLSDTIRIRYAECKAEAIKEFAERLKKDLFYKCGDINYSEICDTRRLIDNLVKEMVGGDDD